MSATAKDKRFYDNQREGFRKIAESAEKGSNTVRNRNLAATARAAESLVGTQRARDLLENKSLKALRSELERAYAVITSGVMGDIQKARDAAEINQPINLPLGSGYTPNEWLEAAEAIQDYSSYLRGYGYTDAEVAAALAYGQYLVRSDTGRKPSERLPRSAKAITVTVHGRPTTYYESNGVLMRSNKLGGGIGMPVRNTFATLAEVYANAKEKGFEVKTHSASEVRAANKEYRRAREHNAREIANAEVSGTKQSKRLSKQSGRVRANRSR